MGGNSLILHCLEGLGRSSWSSLWPKLSQASNFLKGSVNIGLGHPKALAFAPFPETPAIQLSHINW